MNRGPDSQSQAPAEGLFRFVRPTLTLPDSEPWTPAAQRRFVGNSDACCNWSSLSTQAMFFVEFGAGLFARSTALLGDSLDMLGDTLVYGISLYVLSKRQQVAVLGRRSSRDS